MNAAEAHDFHIRAGRPVELNGDVDLEPQHVRRPHRAHQVDGKLRIGALEFHKSRPQPERAERLGDADAHFAAHGGHRTVARPHQAEGCFLHALGGKQDLGALRGGPDAVDMARDQHGSKRAFQVVDLAAQGVGRKSHAICGGTNAAAAGEFEEGADRFPIGTAGTRT